MAYSLKRQTHYIWRIMVSLWLLIVPLHVAYSKDTKTEEQIKAKLITNYIPYVKWPFSVHKPGTLITVCVIEGDLTAAYLQDNNNHNIKVREKDIRGDFSECHILYINKNYTDDQYFIIKATHGHPILTVSDIRGFAEHGGVTGFQMEPGKEVMLDINMHAAQAAKLDVDTDLIAIMKVYK